MNTPRTKNVGPCSGNSYGQEAPIHDRTLTEVSLDDLHLETNHEHVETSIERERSSKSNLHEDVMICAELGADKIEEFEELLEFSIETKSVISLLGFLMGCRDRSKTLTSSAVHFIGGESSVAWWAFFFGGYAHFEGGCIQRLYDLTFVMSFVACFCTCVMNSTGSDPPFYNVGIGMASSYLHVVGLHQWLFWREFVADEDFQLLLHSFVPVNKFHGVDCELDSRSSETRILSQLRRTCRSGGTILMVLQLLVISLGMYAFPVPAYEESRTLSNAKESKLALTHALLMWIAIPQHIPTIVMSVGLYLFVSRIHSLDFNRITRILVNPETCLSKREASNTNSQIEILEDHLEACCLLVESAQNRLDHSCIRLQYLWMHQLGFAGFQLLVVVVTVSDHLSTWGDDWEDESFSSDKYIRWALYVWHAAVGGLIFLTTLVVPARLTELVQKTPRLVVKGLCSRGWSRVTVAEKMDLGIWGWLQEECAGYRVFIYPVTDTMVARFITVITVITTLYVSGSIV